MSTESADTTARPRPPDLSDDEWRLVRLFRCMSAGERHDYLRDAGLVLMKRLSVNPHFHLNRDRQQSIAVELKEVPEERLLNSWPWDWPRRSYLDFANADDPDGFLSECFQERVEWLLGTSDADLKLAESLL